MKKITFLASMLIATGSIVAQSQRLVFVEAFSQASCGPCASQNPAMNAAISAATSDTVISLKYQTSWPGVDPMNAQNPTEVAARVSYYGVTGVPDRRLDGNMGTSITSTTIRNRYPVASPFTIALNHSFSSDYDSVFITMNITCTQAVTGPLKAHVAMVEKEIQFASAPGSNGETIFYSVMRKMLPDANGTNLATTWTVGQTQTLTFAAPIPSYIYNLNKFAVVAFIQDNTTKNVKQAGYSAPLVLPVSTNDAGVSAISAPATVSCVTSITPTVTIRNYSATTLTSCTVNYQIDGGAVVSMPWTGSLATNASTTFTFPAATVAVGSHSLVTFTSMPNGTNDWFMNNNTKNKSFTIIGTPVAAPVVEGFATAGFPYAGWAVDNPDGAYTWTRVTNAGGFAATGQSLKLEYYSSPSGQIDDFFIPAFDLTAPGNSASLTFDVAYAQYQTENDRLQVHVSTNCGSTWTQLFSKAGSTLATSPAVGSGQFTPSATQWRTETVSLTPYLTQPNVLLRFRGTSNYGNNLFVDNINISSTVTSTQEIGSTGNSIDVYPNPMMNNATIEVRLTETQQTTIDVFNVVGQNVLSINKGALTAGEHKINFDSSELNAGIYFVSLTTETGKITKRVVINK